MSNVGRHADAKLTMPMKRCYLHQPFLLFVIGEAISAMAFLVMNSGGVLVWR